LGLLLLIAFLVWLPSEVKAPSNLPFQELEGTLILLQGNSLVRSHSGALQNDLERQLWEVADKNGLEYDLLYNLAMCESGLIHENRWGDKGLSYGLFQFKQRTFDDYCEGDRENMEDQIECAGQMIAQGLGEKHWRKCWNKLQGRPAE